MQLDLSKGATIEQDSARQHHNWPGSESDIERCGPSGYVTHTHALFMAGTGGNSSNDIAYVPRGGYDKVADLLAANCCYQKRIRDDEPITMYTSLDSSKFLWLLLLFL